RRRARCAALRAPMPRGRRRARTARRPPAGSRLRPSSPRSAPRMMTRAFEAAVSVLPESATSRYVIRIAAAGDLHASEATRERVERAFAHVAAECDVILLAGDLTTTGEPEQARVVADACRDLDVPVFAVLGNHDFHAGRPDELAALIADAGVHVLD